MWTSILFEACVLPCNTGFISMRSSDAKYKRLTSHWIQCEDRMHHRHPLSFSCDHLRILHRLKLAQDFVCAGKEQSRKQIKPGCISFCYANPNLNSCKQVALAQREQLSVFGNDYPTKDGTCVRDYIHVMDLAEGHVAALDKVFANPEIGCVPYNLGTGTGSTVLEMIKVWTVAVQPTEKAWLDYAFNPTKPNITVIEACFTQHGHSVLSATSTVTYLGEAASWCQTDDLDPFCIHSIADLEIVFKLILFRTHSLHIWQAFEKASGKTVNHKIVPRRAGDSTAVYAATETAETKLGWKSKLDVNDMCRDQWAWATVSLFHSWQPFNQIPCWRDTLEQAQGSICLPWENDQAQIRMYSSLWRCNHLDSTSLPKYLSRLFCVMPWQK